MRKKKRKKFILVALLALLLIFIVIGTNNLHAEDLTILETETATFNCILVGASSGGGYASRDCKVDPALLDPGECLCDHFLCGDGVTCVSPNKL